MNQKEKHVLLIGLGLIGGSYAMGLKKTGWHVSAITRSQSTVDWALEHAVINEGAAFVDPELIGKAELIIFGLYPTAMVEWIRDNQHLFRSGTLLTDVSGVKCGIVDKIQSFLRDDVEFLGSHPMAGREVSGVRNADERIFVGANFIITPTEKNTEEAIEKVRGLAEELRFGKISILTPEEHDRMIGFVSQLTHAVAVSLMNMSDNTHLKDYTGDSFRDLTRIAKINEVMWSELFFLNKQNLVGLIDDFVASIEELKQTIVEEDTKAIQKLFRRSTERRAYFDK